jgi:hypothetical protein
MITKAHVLTVQKLQPRGSYVIHTPTTTIRGSGPTRPNNLLEGRAEAAVSNAKTSS